MSGRHRRRHRTWARGQHRTVYGFAPLTVTAIAARAADTAPRWPTVDRDLVPAGPPASSAIWAEHKVPHDIRPMSSCPTRRLGAS